MKTLLIIAFSALCVSATFAGDPKPAQSPGFEHARITEAWAKYADVLTFGRGQTLALLDDGCKPEMPQWKVVIDGKPKTRIRYDAVDDDNDASHEGRGYHGSTIGNPSSLNFEGKHGVAFNNQIAIVRSLECCHCKVSDSVSLARGLQWVIDHHKEHDITTVNLAPVDDKEHAEPVATEIDSKLAKLRELGIWVSAPAGNHNYTKGISWPASQPNCFAIGAVKPGKDVVHLDRNKKIALVVPASATSSSNAILCGASMLLREAIEKTRYDWKSKGSNMPEVMMKVFQETGKAVNDPATGHTFRRLDVLAALDFVFNSGAEPPIRAAEGLFDFSKPETLGLKTISGEHAQIFRATDEGGYRFSHHPGLMVFKNRIYCSWSNGYRHEDRPDQRVLIASSADGIKWSKPSVLAQPHEGLKGSCVAAGFYVNGENLVAYYTLTHDYPSHNLYNPKNAVFAVTSNDGVKWSEPKKVASGFFIEKPLQLDNGRLLLGGEHVGDKWKTHQVRMNLLYSDKKDGITGWKEAQIDPSASEPKGLKVFGYTEPNAFVRNDGGIVCLFRNSSGFLYASVSRDKGESWSVPHVTNFPDSTARFSTGKLPDGRVYLINNPGGGKKKRGMLSIALSEDEVLFGHAWLIRSDPTKQRFEGKSKMDGWQYPNALVWQDSLFVAYSVNKEDVMMTKIPLSSFKR